MIVIPTTKSAEQDRTAAFRSFAQSRAAGEVLAPPTLLPPEERRLYVRRTLREDHQFRIMNRPEGAQGKFATLAESIFSFLRHRAAILP